MQRSRDAQFSSLKSNTITKFLSSAEALGKRGVLRDDFDEPTYVGFMVKFDFASPMVADIGGNLNYMPQGLLGSKDAPYSAETYLRSINEDARADGIKAFNDILWSISENTPYYIQEVGGVDSLYKINPENNFRAKDAKIILKMLDGLDLRTYALMDLYRRCAFDTTWMRWTLPDIHRYFAMDIYITEFRSFHVPTSGQRYSEGSPIGPDGDGSVGDNVKRKTTEGVPGVGGQTAKKGLMQTAEGYKDQFNDIEKSIAEAGGAKDFAKGKIKSLIDAEGTLGPSNNLHFLSALEKNLNVIHFRLEECEFDLKEFSPGFGSDLTNVEGGDPLSAEIPIMVGKIREAAEYTLLGASVFRELENLKTAVISDKGMDRNVLNSTKTPEEYLMLLGEGSKDGISQAYKTKLTDHLNKSDDVVKASLGERLLDGADQVVTNAVKNAAKTLLNGLKLGNVYGFAPSKIGAIAADPRAVGGALVDLIRNQFNDDDANAILANIYGNLPGPSARLNREDPGEVGLTGANTNTSGAPGSAGLTGGNSNTTGTPGNAGLVGPPTKPSNGGNIGLTGSTPILGNPGGIGLTGANSTIDGNPGPVGLTGGNSNIDGSNENISLAGADNSIDDNTGGGVGLSGNDNSIDDGNDGNVGLPGNDNSIDDGDGNNVGLSGADSSIDGSNSQVGLVGTDDSIDGNPGNVGLSGAEVNTATLNNVGLSGTNSSIDGDAGDVGLTGSESSIEGNPGDVGLSGAEATAAALNNIGLSGAKAVDSKPGAVDLSGSDTNIDGNPGPVGLTGAENTDADITNVGLTGAQKTEASLENVGLSGPKVNTESLGNIGLSGTESENTSPGNVGLKGAEIKEADLENVGLSGSSVKSEAPGNVGLKGAEGKDGQPGNIGFSSKEKVEDKPRNVGLTGNFLRDQALGNVGQKGAEIKEERPGNVDLTGANNKIPDTLPNVDLNGPSIPSKSTIGNVRLTGNEQSNDALGNVGLTGASDTNDDLGNVGLSGPHETTDIPGNVGLTGSSTPKVELSSDNIGLDGNESSTSPAAGNSLQTSNDDQDEPNPNE